MWNGGGRPHNDETSRRLSIELAIAQHTGSSAPYNNYDDHDQAAHYRRPMSMNQEGEGTHHPQHHHRYDDREDYQMHSHSADHPRGRSDGDHYGSAKMPVDSDEDSDDDAKQAAAPQARGKPEAMAAKLASAARLQAKMDELEHEEKDVEVVAQPVDESMDTGGDGDAADAVVAEAKTPAPAPKKKNKKSPTPKKKPSSNTAHPTMDDPVKPITDVEYQNLQSLMVQFCRVPLLAEFSRPVALLHPEVSDTILRCSQ
jgi:hypothetical protein